MRLEPRKDSARDNAVARASGCTRGEGVNDQEVHGLGESAGVNRFDDKSLAGTVPPTTVDAHEPSVETSGRSSPARAMMRQMDEPARFIRLVRSKKRDKTNTS